MRFRLTLSNTFFTRNTQDIIVIFGKGSYIRKIFEDDFKLLQSCTPESWNFSDIPTNCNAWKAESRYTPLLLQCARSRNFGRTWTENLVYVTKSLCRADFRLTFNARLVQIASIHKRTRARARIYILTIYNSPLSVPRIWNHYEPYNFVE